MKFSVRQMLASAAGAVVAASIASFFGVKGTIIGVAIGSAAATFGTALAAQSLDRTHKAVRQVVVRAPEASLLRRLGGTDAAGAVIGSAPAAETGVAEEATSNEAHNIARVDETVPTGIPSPAGPSPTAILPEVSGTGAGAGAVADSSGSGVRPRRWPAVAGTVAIVFVLSLMFVTVVELIAGRPLADLFGGTNHGSGTSVQNIFGGTGGSTHPTTTTSTVPLTTTTSTTAGATTTTTGSTTTTTAPSTTTTGPSTTTSGPETTTSGP